jgi:integrase
MAQPNLMLRGQRFYLRVAPPADVQILLGRRDIWRSLKTTDRKEAQKRLHVAMVDLHAEWDELRRKQTITPADIEHAVWDRFCGLLEADERFRENLPTEDDLNEVWRHMCKDFGDESIVAFRTLEDIAGAFDRERQLRGTREAQLRHEVARGETTSVAAIVREVLARSRLEPSNTPAHKKLAQSIARADLEALRHLKARDEGQFGIAITDPIVREPRMPKAPIVLASETLMGFFDRYQRERPAALSADTWKQNRKIVALFADFAGPKAHVSTMNRKIARTWRDHLFDWPKKAAEIKEFRSLGFLETIEANKRVSKPTIDGKTINKYLSALGGFFKYLSANDHVSDLSLDGIYLELDKQTKKVFPFTDAQLGAIFSAPLFGSCLGNKGEHLPGNVQIRDWRYWLPLIALYSGARLGEIAQLLVADIKEIHGVQCMHIHKGGDDQKSVKTRGSERVVPVHQKLIQLGFLDYLASLQARAEKRLFPEIKPDARGFVSGVPSGFFQDFLKHVGVKTDASLNFHSFRHTAADAFRRAGYRDEEFAPLLGHTAATMTQRYGTLQEGSVKTRSEMINRLAYPMLSLLD